MRLYFNPDCSKCRAARALLEDAGHAPTIVPYMTEPPDRETLARLIDALDQPAMALLRGAGTAFEDGLDRNRVIEILRAAPERMQRPVLEHAGHALIARPPERVLELIEPASTPGTTP